MEENRKKEERKRPSKKSIRKSYLQTLRIQKNSSSQYEEGNSIIDTREKVNKISNPIKRIGSKNIVANYSKKVLDQEPHSRKFIENPRMIHFPEKQKAARNNDGKKKLKRIGKKVWVSAYKQCVDESGGDQHTIEKTQKTELENQEPKNDFSQFQQRSTEVKEKKKKISTIKEGQNKSNIQHYTINEDEENMKTYRTNFLNVPSNTHTKYEQSQFSSQAQRMLWIREQEIDKQLDRYKNKTNHEHKSVSLEKQSFPALEKLTSNIQYNSYNVNVSTPIDKFQSTSSITEQAQYPIQDNIQELVDLLTSKIEQKNQQKSLSQTKSSNLADQNSSNLTKRAIKTDIETISKQNQNEKQRTNVEEKNEENNQKKNQEIIGSQKKTHQLLRQRINHISSDQSSYDPLMKAESSINYKYKPLPMMHSFVNNGISKTPSQEKISQLNQIRYKGIKSPPDVKNVIKNNAPLSKKAKVNRGESAGNVQTFELLEGRKKNYESCSNTVENKDIKYGKQNISKGMSCSVKKNQRQLQMNKYIQEAKQQLKGSVHH